MLKKPENQKIAICGLGQEGVSVANFLGSQNQITVIDKKPKKDLHEFLQNLKVNFDFYQENEIPENLHFDLIFRSPGIRPDDEILNKIKSENSKLTSVTNLFFELCPAKIIGITGTKGKGTTSTLITLMLKEDEKDAHLAGNIGLPALDILENLTENSYAVLELSSFQLMGLDKSPHLSVVLMITSEHLDWHTTKEEYHDAKATIVQYQTPNDLAVINQDFEISKSFSQKTKGKVFFFSTKEESNGAFIKNDKIVSTIGGEEEIISTNEIALPGAHNLQNALAATVAVKLLGVKKQSITKVLKSFKGLEHRLQLVRELNGTKYYNDTFSTTPETTIAAINSFPEPKILILGGSSKNSDFTELGRVLVQSTSLKTLILIGLESQNIKQAIAKAGGFKGNIKEGLQNMKQIVDFAQKDARKGDIVLLSPACASFDMFKNYKERGKEFIALVNELN